MGVTATDEARLRPVLEPAPQRASSDALPLRAKTIEAVRGAQRWVQMLSFLGALAVALTLVIAGILFSTGFSEAMSEGRVLKMALAGAYIACGAVVFVPVMLLRHYGLMLQDLQMVRTEESLQRAMRAQQIYWMTVGGIMVVSMILSAAVLIAPTVMSLL